MRHKILLWPAGCLLLTLCGCSRSISVQLPAQKLVVLVYADGKVAERCSIAPGSEKFRKLADLVQQGTARWHSRIGAYVPSLLVVGADITLNFRSDSVDLTYSGGDYIRSISPDAYAFLRCKGT
ncbi:MAG TPA: hypothetical protein VMC02_13380 [Steroidobacteraceae bacterium]|nr:hypothetical protein [Steroidobacteraceae bacterium]